MSCCVQSTNRNARLLAVALAGALLTNIGCGSRVVEPAPSIILIVVDALRADHLGLYGYPRQTSPHLDAWAEYGVVFEHAYATSSWTLPSFGSILTGHLPSGHAAGLEIAQERAGVQTREIAARHFVILDEDVRTIPEMLAERGFVTGAFVSNPFLDPRFGLRRGFDDYDHYETSNSDLRRADEVVDLSLDWVDAHEDRPFFLMVHLFDPHMDYDAPPPFRGRFAHDRSAHPAVRGMWPIRNRLPGIPDAERQLIVDAYDEEIAFVDWQVNRFLAGLEGRGLLDRSLVVLTSDHGEELFEHGGFEHGHALYEEVIRVPLVLWAPWLTPGREPAPVSLIDLAPTMLEAAGVALMPDLIGMSLPRGTGRPDSEMQRPIIAERLLYGPDTRAIISWPFKAILEVESGEVELFDLINDPAEQHDLAAGHQEQLSDMLETMADLLDNARNSSAAVEVELDTDLFRRLRSLGYVR